VTEILRLENLTRVFTQPNGAFGKPRQMTAVRDVSLTVWKGEVVGIVGESGCGKSTLARLILRLVEPTSGRVLHGGTDITQLSHRALQKARKNMAMVFQDPYSSLDPRYTVADCLAEPFVVQGIEVPKGRIEALLDQVGLSHAMAQSYPHRLSGGQRQRVGIARALALSPDLLILDEPTASLDVSIQAQIIALLRDLQAEIGLTYIFISHDLGLVRYFCNRIVVMYLGSVVEEIRDPRSPPQHPYTATLMASTFAPDPRRRKDLVALEGEIPSPFNLPPGCAFAGRCPRASDFCRTEMPVLTPALGEHSVACFDPVPVSLASSRLSARGQSGSPESAFG
jgi:oligopeptide/dipeptide ABC transporter ATP-binding protein